MRVFLAGGGNAEESRLLDQMFVQQVDQSMPLIYIPNAMKNERYPGCLEWFKDMINGVGIKNINMITDLERYARENQPCSGIYVGGGNTTKLLTEVRNSGFDKYLKSVILANVPVYGGSARAIILGETILTAPESRDLRRENACGLDILNGFSVVCHYDGKEDLKVLCRELDIKVMAIPEKSGVYIEDKSITVIGYEPITVFDKNKKIIVNPWDTEKMGYKLFGKELKTV
jgi:dipeptidase E